MPGDSCAYEARYPVGYWKPVPVIVSAAFTFYALSMGREGLIPAGILWAVVLLTWACVARFGRKVALRVDSAGITVRKHPWEKKTTSPWNDVGYLVIWHDERHTSLSVQPLGGTKQPMRLDGMPRPANYLTVRARALDERRLVSAVTSYRPAVEIVDGDTGFPITVSSPRS